MGEGVVVRFFGEQWRSRSSEVSWRRFVAVPVGQRCMGRECGQPIGPHDEGMLLPFAGQRGVWHAYHRICAARELGVETFSGTGQPPVDSC